MEHPESNEGHVRGSMGGNLWTDAKDVIEKTDALLTKGEPLIDRLEKLLARVEKSWLLKWFF